MEDYKKFIRKLVERDGPQESDYSELDGLTAHVHSLVQGGSICPDELASFRKIFGRALSPDTLQGHTLAKPHGYAGDYEIIDRIYRRHVSDDPLLKNWDAYYHYQPASHAVRNRKAYFHALLDAHSKRKSPLRVLNVASGPGRCMYEWLTANPDANVHFHCIEIDPDAIAYASNLNREFLNRITLSQQNAIQFRPQHQYDIIWAAGIFDYFNDRLFTRLLQRLARALAPDGELVVGNFSTSNPSRPGMELLGEWFLHHRTHELLIALATAAEIQKERIRIGSEPEGINLFLHISNEPACREGRA